MKVTYLQFANATVTFAPNNLKNIKRPLRCFQLASGLRINFDKSSLIGIYVDSTLVSSWANLINCNMESLLVKYLGLSLCGSSSMLALN